MVRTHCVALHWSILVKDCGRMYLLLCHSCVTTLTGLSDPTNYIDHPGTYMLSGTSQYPFNMDLLYSSVLQAFSRWIKDVMSRIQTQRMYSHCNLGRRYNISRMYSLRPNFDFYSVLADSDASKNKQPILASLTYLQHLFPTVKAVFPLSRSLWLKPRSLAYTTLDPVSFNSTIFPIVYSLNICWTFCNGQVHWNAP